MTNITLQGLCMQQVTEESRNSPSRLAHFLLSRLVKIFKIALLSLERLFPASCTNFVISTCSRGICWLTSPLHLRLLPSLTSRDLSFSDFKFSSDFSLPFFSPCASHRDHVINDRFQINLTYKFQILSLHKKTSVSFGVANQTWPFWRLNTK